MRVSGHKSESSIRSYSRRLSEAKQKEISLALSSACSVENLESTSTEIPGVANRTQSRPIKGIQDGLACDREIDKSFIRYYTSQ